METARTISRAVAARCLLGVLLSSSASADERQPLGGFTIIHPRDGAPMVWVPGGSFLMGINAHTAQKQAEQIGYRDYHEIAAEEAFPERSVYVDGFYMDKFEVTIERWKKFTDAHPDWKQDGKGILPPTWLGPELKAEHAQLPIAQVTWRSAQQYANWARKQLPTEAMWEKAARGTDARWYPWGNEKPDPQKHGVLSMTDSPLPGVQPVGSYPAGASPYGCLDMAGNVYEWTSEWKEPYPNNPEAPEGAPSLKEWGHRFVALRGGSFYHTRHSYRVSKRFGFEENETYYHVGFRTAWYPPAGFDHRAHAAPPVHGAKKEQQPEAVPALPSVASQGDYLSEFSRLAQVRWPGNRTLTVVCHGHSVPAGYFQTPDVRTFDAYPHLLHLALKQQFPFAVINVIVTARGGEASTSGAERFERDVLALRPDIVTIDYGLNDRGAGLEAARKAWATMIDQAQQKNVKVVLLTPTPDTSSRLSEETDPLNQHAAQIQALAAEYHVAIADSLAAFSEATSGGQQLSSLMSQGNHPNRMGHELVAQRLIRWFPTAVK